MNTLTDKDWEHIRKIWEAYIQNKPIQKHSSLIDVWQDADFYSDDLLHNPYQFRLKVDSIKLYVYVNKYPPFSRKVLTQPISESLDTWHLESTISYTPPLK